MGEEQNEFIIRFKFAIHKRIDPGLLLDEFLKRLQSIREDGKRIVTIEMEIVDITRQEDEVIYEFVINTFFEGDVSETWAHQKVEAALKTSLVPFFWVTITKG